MTTYNDIKDMTNEEASAYFGPMTLNPIPCGDLENLLNWGGEASRGSVSGAWEGLLIDFMLLNAIPELSEGLDELFTHLNQPRSTVIDTTEQPWAGKMEDLLNGLVVAGAVDASLIDDVIALGGGQPNIGTDYQAIRDDHEEALAKSANSIKHANLFNEHISPVLGGSDAEIVQGLNAMAQAWSN
jgi:hypothetical protein